MKKLIIASTILFLTAFPTKSYAFNNDFNEQDYSFLDSTSLNGNLSLGYDYSYSLSDIQNGKVNKLNNGFIGLDNRFNSSIYINNADISLSSTFLKLFSVNFSTSLVSREFIDEPLINYQSYQDYKTFLNNRRKNIATVWQRYGIIKDLNIIVKDQSVDGSFIIGQQLIPFGYTDNNTLNMPVTSNPIITPMTEYINYNLLSDTDTPYQNSSLTNVRDIGMTLTGNYSFLRFMTGIYNGSGSNTFDNNNQKDIFGRFDLMAQEMGEIGVSHWRGRRVTYRSIYSNNSERNEFEMSKTGIHSKLGNKDLYLMGECIFSNDKWLDETLINQFSWYVAGVGNLWNILNLTLRYESFYDNNVLKVKSDLTNYNIKRAVISFQESLSTNIKLRQEYTHTWEDISSKTIDKVQSNYGIFSANLIFSF